MLLLLDLELLHTVQLIFLALFLQVIGLSAQVIWTLQTRILVVKLGVQESMLTGLLDLPVAHYPPQLLPITYRLFVHNSLIINEHQIDPTFLPFHQKHKINQHLQFNWPLTYFNIALNSVKVSQITSGSRKRI